MSGHISDLVALHDQEAVVTELKRPRRILQLSCSLTSDLRVTAPNRMLAMILGFTFDELDGMHAARLAPPDYTDEERETLTALFTAVQRGEVPRIAYSHRFARRRDDIVVPYDAVVTWNKTQQRWDWLGEVDANDIPEFRQAQFPPGDPYAELARMLQTETIEANRRREMQALIGKLEEHAALLRDMQNRSAHPDVQAMAATAAAAAMTVAMQQLKTWQAERDHTPVEEPALPPEEPELKDHVFDIPEWNTYAGFREHTQRIWKTGMTRTVLAGLCGVTLKTLWRARRFYRVGERRYWPPPKLPEQQPKAPRRVKLPRVSDLGGMAAAALMFVITVDSLDGRVDGMLHMCLRRIMKTLSEGEPLPGLG